MDIYTFVHYTHLLRIFSFRFHLFHKLLMPFAHLLHLSFFYINFLSDSYSSSDKVTPLPIFSCSGDQSLMSYFGAAPFQLMRLSSFLQPFVFSDKTPSSSTISYLKSAISLLLIFAFPYK